MPTDTTLRSNKVDSLTTKLIDFHSRRITNAADAVDDQDYVTLAQLKSLVKGISQVVDQSVTNTTNTTTVTTTAIVDIHSLTTTTTSITASAAPSANGILVVILKQDATGGRRVTWTADFYSGPTSINILPNGVSVVIFAADGAKWRQSSPLLG